MNSDVVVSARNLTKIYHFGYYNPYEGWMKRGLRRIGLGRQKPLSTPTNILRALDDISFDVHQGEILGVIGKNGAGKSTLLKVLAKITHPSLGYVDIKGKVGALLEVGTGFHPELTGRENVFLNATILGLNADQIRKQFDEIVAFAELEQFIDTPVKHYSSGMYARLAFSVAAYLSPDILIVDEVLSVGDIGFQKKSLGKMEDVVRGGRTVIIVSHSIGQIVSFTSRCLWLEKGHLVMDGPTTDVVKAYQEKVQIARIEQIAGVISDHETDNKNFDGIILNTEPANWDEPTPENQVEGSPEQRYGNGKARITSITFSPLGRAQGQPHRVLRCGDDLKLVFTIKAVEEIVNAQLDIAIRDNIGNLVVFSSPIVKGYAINIQPGRSMKLSITYKNLLLKPGIYTFHCYLGRRGYYNIDGLTNLYKFEIEPNLEQIKYDHLYPGIYECDFDVHVDK